MKNRPSKTHSSASIPVNATWLFVACVPSTEVATVVAVADPDPEPEPDPAIVVAVTTVSGMDAVTLPSDVETVIS